MACVNGSPTHPERQLGEIGASIGRTASDNSEADHQANSEQADANQSRECGADHKRSEGNTEDEQIQERQLDALERLQRPWQIIRIGHPPSVRRAYATSTKTRARGLV